jgi:hypothetical protein
LVKKSEEFYCNFIGYFSDFCWNYHYFFRLCRESAATVVAYAMKKERVVNLQCRTCRKRFVIPENVFDLDNTRCPNRICLKKLTEVAFLSFSDKEM